MYNYTNNHCVWYHEVAAKTSFPIVFNVITPAYFILGMVGHVFCLVIYYKNAQKEKAYLYQIFVTVSETIEISIFMASEEISAHCSGRMGLGNERFMSNYVAMWCAAHVILPLTNCFVMSSLLFSIALVADRVFAILKPFQHKNANHSFIQAGAVAFSLTLATLVSLVDGFRVHVTENGASYKLELNTVFVDSLLGSFLSHFRNAARFFLVIVLIVCNITLVCVYRSYRLKFGSGSTGSNRSRNVRRGEKTLIILAVSQSILISIGNFSLMTLHLLVYTSSDVYVCVYPLWSPIFDSVLQLSSIWNFYIFLFTSKQFREAVAAYLCKNR